MLVTQETILNTVSYESSQIPFNMTESEDTYKEITTIIGTNFNDYLIA